MAGKSYVVYDIWLSYVTKLLEQNPTWLTRHAKSLSHFKIVKIERTIKERLVSVTKKRANGPQQSMIRRKYIVKKEVEIMNYNWFRKLVEHYFDRAKQAVIKGEAIDITNSVGKIVACMVQRDFTKKAQRRVNYGATRKQPRVWDERLGKSVPETIIYFVNDDWCRIKWMKTKNLAGELSYEFKPAAANAKRTSGFKLEFSESLQKDPLLKFRYLFNPVIR